MCVCVSVREMENDERMCLGTGMFIQRILFFIFIFGNIIYITKTVHWHKFQTSKLANSILKRDNGRIRERMPLAPNTILHFEI